MREKTGLVAVLLMLTVMLMFSTSTEAKGKGKGKKKQSSLVGQQAPDWSIKAAVGEKTKTKLEDYKGKWVLVEFWFPQ